MSNHIRVQIINPKGFRTYKISMQNFILNAVTRCFASRPWRSCGWAPGSASRTAPAWPLSSPSTCSKTRRTFSRPRSVHRTLPRSRQSRTPSVNYNLINNTPYVTNYALWCCIWAPNLFLRKKILELVSIALFKIKNKSMDKQGWKNFLLKRLRNY